MSRLLVVNADDFGLAQSVNEGVLRAHREGIVTSASLMVSRPAASAAARLAGEHPGLSVGLHFEAPPDLDVDQPTHLDSHHHVHLENDRLAVFQQAGRRLGVPVRGDAAIRYVGEFYGQSPSGDGDLTHIEPEYLEWLLRNELREGVTEIGCHPAVSVDGFTSRYAPERVVELATLTAPGLRDRVHGLGIELVGFRDLASKRGADVT